MGNLLSAHSISKSYSSRFLFSDVSLHIHDQEKLGIIGPNGSGKSTLLKILSSLERPDDGEVTLRKGKRIHYVPQQDDFKSEETPLDILLQADSDFEESDAKRALSKLGFERFNQPIKELSGGWRKRVSLAIGIAKNADIMLLDEPTNHLDVEAMIWLENYINKTPIAFIFVTHDRSFLENCASRILELASTYPEGFFEVAGNYSEFVRRKEAYLLSQEAMQAALANKVRRDTAWLRQGIQGRQTRNKTQVQDASSRRADLRSLTLRNDSKSKTATIEFDSVGRKTNRLIAGFNISMALGGKQLFQNLDIELSPGKRCGVVGSNGSGKTTLIKVLGKTLEPNEGSVKWADDLKIIYSSQERQTVDPNITLEEALCPIGEMVDYRGSRVHVSGWADRFLFSKSQLKTLVGSLSGGEQARVHIARLMLQPADVLFLDEPTNDLDIPTLQVLEETIQEFQGAVVLITHDRFLLERVATTFIELDGKGNAKEQEDYQKLYFNCKPIEEEKSKTKVVKERHKTETKKLTYKLQQEFNQMESLISTKEQELESYETKLESINPLQQHQEHADVCVKVAALQHEVQSLYSRWAELEAMQA